MVEEGSSRLPASLEAIGDSRKAAAAPRNKLSFDERDQGVQIAQAVWPRP